MKTVEGNELIDFCGSWGPLVLGHARHEVIEAICEAAGRGTSYGTNSPYEVEFAELICEMVPSMEMVRLVSSGTEAVMTALRLARGVTGRDKLVKFDGCYHGHVDSMLVSAGSGLLTGGISSSAGVPDAVVRDVLVVPYNDLKALETVMASHGALVAAIIVEPVAGNMGLVLPEPGFLEGLRAAADRYNTLLIFDEVITGFRLGPTTYGQLCGVRPDLTILGKIIGGGMPIGAVGGRASVMKELAPLGRVYQAGTLSGNPVAIAAGMTTLKILKEENPYSELERLGRLLAAGLNAAAADAHAAMRCVQLGGMFTPFFTSTNIMNLADTKSCSTRFYARFFRHMLGSGFYLPPSQFEVGFVCAAHSKKDIQSFVAAAGAILHDLGEEENLRP